MDGVTGERGAKRLKINYQNELEGLMFLRMDFYRKKKSEESKLIIISKKKPHHCSVDGREKSLFC